MKTSYRIVVYKTHYFLLHWLCLWDDQMAGRSTGRSGNRGWEVCSSLGDHLALPLALPPLGTGWVPSLRAQGWRLIPSPAASVAGPGALGSGHVGWLVNRAGMCSSVTCLSCCLGTSLSLLCPGGRSPCRVSTLFVGCSQSVCRTLVKGSARFSNGVCRWKTFMGFSVYLF